MRTPVTTALILGTLLGATLHADAQTGKRLWVLQAPDQIVEYDLHTFAPKLSLKLPPEALQHPENLLINRQGQMLFSFPPLQDASDLPADKLWLWDGQAGQLLARGVTRRRTPAGDNLAVLEAVPACMLSADGAHLYWFENRFQKLSDKGNNVDLSVITTYRGWRTDLEGSQPQPLASVTLPKCECGTSVCSETCPEAIFWAPNEGVDDFFLVTLWIPGQIGSTFQSSVLYQRSGDKWTAKPLPAPLEQVLDAAGQGSVLLSVITDAGCCGWDNESDDRTLLWRDGKSTVVFDEREHYHNDNYDVSFFTTNARLSPDRHAVAYTVAATAPAGAEIRLADSGQPAPEELARIQQALRELPAVEMVRLDPQPKRAAVIPHATLVGWLSDKEILVLADQELQVFDTGGHRRTESRIKVSNPSWVFLR
jgi:hypothetical protein